MFMFVYILFILILVGGLSSAVWVLKSNLRKEGLLREHEYNVLENPDTIIDTLIEELMRMDKTAEDEEKIKERKKDILNTFIELHRSGSFCAHLTEEEVIRFVKNKLINGE